ncbi:hypothetical protein YC2023_081038 [Brassica napus]
MDMWIAINHQGGLHPSRLSSPSTPVSGGEEVIKGLRMRAGDKRRLIIPPSLGYTEEGLNKEDVPKNSWLIYEVEAVKVR